MNHSVEINGSTYTIEQLLEAQLAVDQINEGRRDARQQNRWNYLSRMAALKWVEDNPVKAGMSMPSTLSAAE